MMLDAHENYTYHHHHLSHHDINAPVQDSYYCHMNITVTWIVTMPLVYQLRHNVALHQNGKLQYVMIKTITSQQLHKPAILPQAQAMDDIWWLITALCDHG